MLRSFIEDSEKHGTAYIKSHSAIEKGEYIENIII